MKGVLFRVARFAEAFILTEEPEGEAMAIKGYMNAAGALPIAAALLLGACTTVALKGEAPCRLQRRFCLARAPQ